ncbi:MAG: hypothetical protein ACRC0J_01330 [Shewanella oncorhynchi]
MQEKIKEAIECWANRPTWFTSHPSDEKELRNAISNLRTLSPRPTILELKSAIFDIVEDAPAMLGSPTNVEKAAEDFARKIHSKI